MGQIALRAVPDRDAFDVLVHYARSVADEMGLRDYEIAVSEEPPDDPRVRALVNVHPDRKIVRLAFCEGFELLPADEQRHVVCHEIAHVHLARAADMLMAAIGEEFGGAARRLLEHQVRREFEEATEAIACFHAPYLPLIDWQH